MKQKPKHKKIPHYWWDFSEKFIIVESDSDKYPVVARFEFESLADKAIELAEKYISDLNAGRVTPVNIK